MVKILFVCTGNICRSPSAEGVLRHAAKQQQLSNNILVDSAGTHGYHIGENPDHRSINTAKARGIELSDLVARKFSHNDYEEFDLILAMDQSHYDQLYEMAPDEHKERIKLFLEFADKTDETEVPDPYYGSQADFEHVLDLIETGTEGLLEKLQKHYLNST